LPSGVPGIILGICLRMAFVRACMQVGAYLFLLASTHILTDTSAGMGFMLA